MAKAVLTITNNENGRTTTLGKGEAREFEHIILRGESPWAYRRYLNMTGVRVVEKIKGLYESWDAGEAAAVETPVPTGGVADETK